VELELLLNGICKHPAPTITSMDFTRNPLLFGNNDSYLVLARLLTQPQSRLEELILDNCEIEDHGLAFIAKKLEDDKLTITAPLKRVSLAKNHISCEGAAALTSLLTSNRTLVHLRLAENRIRDQGGASLAKLLSVHESLRVLDLAENQISDGGAVALAKALETRHLLKSLQLQHNDHISPVGARALTHMAQRNQSLESLSFLSHRLKEQGLVVMRLIYHYGVSS